MKTLTAAVFLSLLLLPKSSWAQSPYVKISFESGKPVVSYKGKDSLLNLYYKGIKNSSDGPVSNVKTFLPNPSGINGTINVSVTTTGSTCEYNNGRAAIVANGGTPPYQYSVNGGAWWLSTGNFPNLYPDSYTALVKDAAGNTGSSPFTIPNTYALPTLGVSSYQRNSSCTSADGSVTLLATGGTPPYTYSKDLVNFQTSNVFSGLPAGEYLFFVRDANGCTRQFDSFNLLCLESSSCFREFGFGWSQFACGNEGNIDFDIGPDPPYYISLDGINYAPLHDFYNLTAGIYLFYLKNGSGEIQIFAIGIYPQCSIRLDFITVDAACGENNGTLTATASLGRAPYTYTIDGINYYTNNTFTGLAPGNYYVTVKDADGVTSSAIGTVYDRCPQVSLTATPESCAKNDGTITATATRGTAPYQYSKDGINYQPGNTFTGLATGNYTIFLKDALGFITNATTTVTYQCISIVTTVNNTSCGNHNGKISINAANGTAPYMYSLDGTNFQYANSFSNLATGNYTVTVKDLYGQIGTKSVTVTDQPAPDITVTAKNPSCSNNDGQLTITVTGGGTAPFQYSIDNIFFQSSNSFTGLSAQSYQATVKDANNCSASLPGNIVIECPSITTVITAETCQQKNGKISVTTLNAIGPYQYSLDGINFQAANSFSNLSAGTYTITVKDAFGYSNTGSAVVPDNCPQVTATVTNDFCGSAKGTITATGSGGTPPYQFSLDGANFQSSTLFTGLIAHTYTVTIKDAQGTVNSTQVIIKNIPGPLVSATNSSPSCLDNDGSITLAGSNGTAPLQYSLDGNNYQASSVFKNLKAGTYTGWVKDANGCKNSVNITLSTSNNLNISAGSSFAVCKGDSKKINATGNGTSYLWSPAAGLDNTASLTPVATPAQTTKYYITATLGVCTKKDSVVISVNPTPVAVAQGTTTVCFGQNALLSGSGGITYTWSPSTYLDNAAVKNPSVIKPVSSITYKLKVTDANGCRSQNDASVNITVTAPVKVFAGNDTSVVIDQPFQLHARDINNSGLVHFEWTPAIYLNDAGTANPVSTPGRDILYTVTASTAAGCEGRDEVRIKVFKGPDIYVPTAFTPNSDGVNDLLKAIPIGISKFKYFVVYNRYGEKVFYTEDAGNGWDGKYKNAIQKVSVFIWIAEGVDDKGRTVKRKGSVLLMR